MELKAIPAFYGVYLLRSTVRKASNYIGSTPHPVRRLEQHNGKVKGGAVRTSRASLRPWEMVCVVSGFPSNIAALQFEWALQNPHLTRHIDAEKRISLPFTRVKKNAKTGKTRKKPGRPTTSLLQKLSNMHLLLRSPYFSQWPIEIRFFNQDVYHSWQSWCERVDEQLHPTIAIILDLPQESEATISAEEFTSGQPPTTQRKKDLIGKGGINGVDPTYAHMKDVLQKSRLLLDEDDTHQCVVCLKSLDLKHDLFTVCSASDCQTLSHVSCMANHLLRFSAPETVLPKTGTCPSCRTNLRWLDLMKEVSLRSRGQKEIGKVLATRKKSASAVAAEILETESEGDGDEDEMMAEEDDGDDDASVASMESFASMISTVVPMSGDDKKHVEIVIEDSDEDGG